MILRYVVVAITIFLLIPTILAQEDFVPIKKPIKPKVTPIHSADNNFDKIEDALEQKIAQFPANQTRIIVSLKEPYNENHLKAFESLDGKIVHTYESAIFGFSGKIPFKNIRAFASQIATSLEFIEEDKPTVLHLDKSVKIVRARNIVWDTLGFKGSPNFSIAVLDSGMDDSHPDLLGFQDQGWATTAKLVGWKDTTIDNTLTPVDFDRHGTHVASTALGTGASYGSGVIATTTTTFSATLPMANFCFVDSFEVKKTGTITLEGTVSSGGFEILLINPSGILVAFDDTSPWVIAHSTTTTGIWESWGCNPGGSSGRPFSIKQTYPYEAVGDVHNLFTGVSPDSRLTGVKIFQNDGSGFVSDMTEGFDWIIANKSAYRIKVASMSAGLINGGTSITLRNAANNVVANGIPFTIAAGNDFPGFPIGDPALANKVITVGATNDDDQITDYSSNGPPGSGKPDVVAPGGSFNVKTKITAVDTNDDDSGIQGFPDFNPNDYTNLVGTSMSTPHAAGEAALVIQAMESQGMPWGYTEAEALKVKMILLMTAVETNQDGEALNDPTLDRGGRDLVEGLGRINVDAAIEAIISSHTIGTSESATLNKVPTSKEVWARKTSLTAGTSYQFNLSVPSTGDFDLYLYNLAPDSIGNPIILSKSITAALGGSESVSFNPSVTGNYFLVVKAVSGSGQFTVSSSLVKIISISLIGFPVNFGMLEKGTLDFPAPGNNLNQYIIRVNPETNVNVDIFQRGNDFNAGDKILPIGNMAWSLTNDVATSKPVQKTLELIKSNVPPGTDVTIYYWLDVSSDQSAGDYMATLFVDA